MARCDDRESGRTWTSLHSLRRTTVCDPLAFGGEKCDEQRGPDLQAQHNKDVKDWELWLNGSWNKKRTLENQLKTSANTKRRMLHGKRSVRHSWNSFDAPEWVTVLGWKRERNRRTRPRVKNNDFFWSIPTRDWGSCRSFQAAGQLVLDTFDILKSRRCVFEDSTIAALPRVGLPVISNCPAK